MTKKKIALLIPSLNAGGMERVMSELASYFAKLPELEVHLIMYGRKPELFYRVPSKVQIHRPGFVFNNKVRMWSTFKTLIFLRKKIKATKPDSILSFGEYWNSFVLLALLGFQTPIYISDRCQPDKSLGKFHDLLRKILYPRASGVIVQTQIAKKIYKKIVSEEKLHVIGNPIRKIFSEDPIEKENIVLSVGRLIRSKHHDELIKVFVRIGLPDWKLVIIGDDAIKQQNMRQLQTLIHELNAEDKVILTGTRSDVDLFYLKSKIFAFTSSSEGFPNVIGEAMSAGLPVIAFDCVAGPSELIKHGVNGLLISLYDFINFERELKSLMEDSNYRKKLSSKVVQSAAIFSIHNIGNSYKRIILK